MRGDVAEVADRASAGTDSAFSTCWNGSGASERRARGCWSEAETAARSGDKARICYDVPAAQGVTGGRAGFVHSFSTQAHRKPPEAAEAHPAIAIGRARQRQARVARHQRAQGQPALQPRHVHA